MSWSKIICWSLWFSLVYFKRGVFCLCTSCPSFPVRVRTDQRRTLADIMGNSWHAASWTLLRLPAGHGRPGRSETNMLDSLGSSVNAGNFTTFPLQNSRNPRIWQESCLTLSQMQTPPSPTGWGWGQRCLICVLNILLGVNGVPFLVSAPKTDYCLFQSVWSEYTNKWCICGFAALEKTNKISPQVIVLISLGIPMILLPVLLLLRHQR